MSDSLPADATATRLVTAALDAAVVEVVGVPPPGSSDAAAGRERAMMRAMNLVCMRLGAHLTRWVGADGWRALLRRGLDEAVRAGGAATSLAQGADGELRWTDEATLSKARASCIQVLVGVTRVLARFIGDEMAIQLIERGVAAGERGQGPHHG